MTFFLIIFITLYVIRVLDSKGAVDNSTDMAVFTALVGMLCYLKIGV